jgi:hypothetical protein
MKNLKRKEQEAEKLQDAIDKARQLARTVLDQKQKKSECDEAIKEAISQLTKLAEENPDWFKDTEGKQTKTSDFNAFKLVWKTAASKYQFKEIVLANIVAFAEKFPKSISFELKTITNIDLEQFGIEKTEGKTTLTVE